MLVAAVDDEHAAADYGEKDVGNAKVVVVTRTSRKMQRPKYRVGTRSPYQMAVDDVAAVVVVDGGGDPRVVVDRSDDDHDDGHIGCWTEVGGEDGDDVDVVSSDVADTLLVHQESSTFLTLLGPTRPSYPNDSSSVSHSWSR